MQLRDTPTMIQIQIQNRYHLFSVLWVFLIVLIPAEAQSPETCMPPDGGPNCICETDHGVINLTAIANNDGTPKFKYSYKEYDYYYNPCYAFGIDAVVCTKEANTAVCQTNGDFTYILGTVNTEEIQETNGYQILYGGGTDQRHSEVKLHCDKHAYKPRIETKGDEDTALLYVFDLYTICACPGECGPGGIPSPPDLEDTGNIIGGIGIGIILIAIACFVTYFIVGGLLLKFKFERSGTDIIPQKVFWFSLPGLIKDGIMFTFSPIIRLVKKDYNYDYKPLA